MTFMDQKPNGSKRAVSSFQAQRDRDNLKKIEEEDQKGTEILYENDFHLGKVTDNQFDKKLSKN